MSRCWTCLPLGILSAALLCGCPSSHRVHTPTDAEPPGDTAVQDFLDRLSSAYCEGLESCVGAYAIWPSMQECMARNRQWGPAAADNPLLNWRALSSAAARDEVFIEPAAVEECLDAVRETCLLGDRALLSSWHALPMEACRRAIRPRAPVPNGGRCQWDWQCQAGHECYGGGCGEYDDIVRSVQCCTQEGTCRPLRGAGERCSSSADCGPEAPEGLMWECLGFEEPVCTLLEVAPDGAVGDRCGVVATGTGHTTVTFCATGLLCSRVAGSSGQCTRPGGLGTDCDDDDCAPGLICDEGRCSVVNVDDHLGPGCSDVCRALNHTACDYNPGASPSSECVAVGGADRRCSGSFDCVADEWCDRGVCRSDLGPGGECTGWSQCRSLCCVSSGGGLLRGRCM